MEGELQGHKTKSVAMVAAGSKRLANSIMHFGATRDSSKMLVRRSDRLLVGYRKKINAF
jgi:hypothetical protein